MQAQFRSLTLRALASVAILGGPLAIVGAVPIGASASQTYLVLYGGQRDQLAVQVGIARAGGTSVAAYVQIGVAVARSTNAAFQTRMRHTVGVVDVAPTARYGRRLPDAGGILDSGGPPDESPPGPGQDEVGRLAALQWDMNQISAPQAHQVTIGSRNVLVGIIDTGIDYTHPNLAPNLDFGDSVSCIGGNADQSPAAWNDDNGHGTHVAGTVAATSAEDNLGIDGVAPGVRLAAVKAGNQDGYFFPEAVVCAFMWAGNHHFNVTNNSYYADPWLYNCLDDPGQLAIWNAEKRAIDFAIGQGVTVVAAAGNFNDDLAHPTIDSTSPDAPPGAAIAGRDVSENCFTVPSMVPGVVTVSAVGNLGLKAYYSSFGTGYIKVAAPGGDARYQVTVDAPNGRVLSTFPANPAIRPTVPRVTDCADGRCATFAYLQGTSMASPHVAGLAALIIGRFNGSLSPAQVLDRLTSSTDPVACPPDPFNPTVHSPTFNPAAPPAHCEGSPAYNSFYGYGQINALKAVTEG